MAFNIHSGYPFVAPDKIYFKHKVWHPSVDPDSGEICPDTLETNEWAPTIKLGSVIDKMHGAMGTINWDHPINAAAAQQQDEDNSNNTSKFQQEAVKIAKKNRPP